MFGGGVPDWKDRPPHRFTEGALHDGQHRITPNAAHRAWVDARSPLERARQWLLEPMPTYITYGVIALVFVLVYFNGQQARDTMWIQANTNHLHRSLAMEQARRETADNRVKQLEADVAELTAAKGAGNSKGKGGPTSAGAVATTPAAPAATPMPAAPAMAADPNADFAGGRSRHLETELNRERKRANQLSERTAHLVNELAEVRAEVHTLRGQARDLELENKKLRTILGRLDA